MEEKYLICRKCGNIVKMVKEGKGTISCCGSDMEELIANTVDAAKEKHIPVYVKEENKITVTVGEVNHPMLEEHYIEWILIKTNKGNTIRNLKPGDKPEATFVLENDEKLEEIYAYCNLHGLWKTKI